MGVLAGPSLFQKRNSSIYCDFRGRSFTSPADEINETVVDKVIELAEVNVEVADSTFGKSVEDALEKIAVHASRNHPDYDELGKEALETLKSAFEKLKPS